MTTEKRVEVTTVDELREAFATYPRVRLVGGGSAEDRLPPPSPRQAGELTRISLAGMNRILRLEADDLTCSVEAGVTRDTLDAALAECGGCLPCAGRGPVGSPTAG